MTNKIKIIKKMVIIADALDDYGMVKEADCLDNMIVKIGTLNKEAAPALKYIQLLKNLPVWAREMWPILREVWAATIKMKGNMHLVKDAAELGVTGMDDLKKINITRWEQLWDGLMAYQDALRSLRQSRGRLVTFLAHENKYIVNYAESLIKGIDEFLSGKIDDIE